MSSSRSKIILAALIIVIVAAIFWSRRNKETAPSDSGAVTEQTPTEKTPDTSAVGNQNPTAEPGTGPVEGLDPNRVPPEEGEPFSTAFQKCWAQSPPVGRIGESTDPKSLLFNLEREAMDSQTMYENYHVQTPQGDRRLQVLYQENFPFELRLFSVDSEGLPIPERLTNEEMTRPVDEVLKGYLASGTVIARMAHREINLENGISAEVETSDDEPVEVRVFGMPGGTLSCFKDSCKCIVGRAQRADPSSIPTE